MMPPRLLKGIALAFSGCLVFAGSLYVVSNGQWPDRVMPEATPDSSPASNRPGAVTDTTPTDEQISSTTEQPGSGSRFSAQPHLSSQAHAMQGSLDDEHDDEKFSHNVDHADINTAPVSEQYSRSDFEPDAKDNRDIRSNLPVNMAYMETVSRDTSPPPTTPAESGTVASVLPGNVQNPGNQQAATDEDIESENPFLPDGSQIPETPAQTTAELCPRVITDHMKTEYNYNKLVGWGCDVTGFWN